LKLGIDVGQATVAKYLVRHRRPPSQTWKTFLANHVGQIAAADFFVVPTATCRLLFVLVILAHERRRVVHAAVIDHPTAAWTAQQLREAFPWDEGPCFLVRDRDPVFNTWATTATAMNIQELLTAARGDSPHGGLHHRYERRAAQRGSTTLSCSSSLAGGVALAYRTRSESSSLNVFNVYRAPRSASQDSNE